MRLTQQNKRERNKIRYQMGFEWTATTNNQFHSTKLCTDMQIMTRTHRDPGQSADGGRRWETAREELDHKNCSDGLFRVRCMLLPFFNFMAYTSHCHTLKLLLPSFPNIVVMLPLYPKCT